MKKDTKNWVRSAIGNEAVASDLYRAWAQVIGKSSVTIGAQAVPANGQYETADLPLTMEGEHRVGFVNETVGMVWGTSAIPEAGLIVTAFVNAATNTFRIRLSNNTGSVVNWVSKTVNVLAIAQRTT